MTRVEPSTGTCPQCGHAVIDAELDDGRITLDATPNPAGPYTAFRGVAGWIAAPHDAYGAFLGSRRSVHVCPDYQLDLSSEAQSGPATVHQQES